MLQGALKNTSFNFDRPNRGNLLVAQSKIETSATATNRHFRYSLIEALPEHLDAQTSCSVWARHFQNTQLKTLLAHSTNIFMQTPAQLEKDTSQTPRYTHFRYSFRTLPENADEDTSKTDFFFFCIVWSTHLMKALNNWGTRRGPAKIPVEITSSLSPLRCQHIFVWNENCRAMS